MGTARVCTSQGWALFTSLPSARSLTLPALQPLCPQLLSVQMLRLPRSSSLFLKLSPDIYPHGYSFTPSTHFLRGPLVRLPETTVLPVPLLAQPQLMHSQFPSSGFQDNLCSPYCPLRQACLFQFIAECLSTLVVHCVLSLDLKTKWLLLD